MQKLSFKCHADNITGCAEDQTELSGNCLLVEGSVQDKL